MTISPKPLDAVRAIIFDMDGVIFDSESVYYHSCFDAAKSLGYEFSPEFVGQFTGLTSQAARLLLQHEIGAENVDDFWHAWGQARMTRLRENGLGFKIGFPEFFEKVLATGLPLAIVTSAGRRDIHENFEKTRPEWLDQFQFLIAVEDVNNPKPHPEPYQMMMQKLGVMPEEALIIEDSRSGTTAALASGANVIMINEPETLPEDMLSKLAFHSDDYAEINDFLTRAGVFAPNHDEVDMNEKHTQNDTTHFGYQQVDLKEKVNKVGEVFDSVATRYDIMNDVMSLGVHRFWKHYAILLADVREGMSVLDLASGTGDLAIKMGKKLNGTGRLVASDINPNMLNIAEDRLLNEGLLKNVECVVANAETLPFEDNSFDLITMAFGLRNVTDKDQALAEMYRVLKPGGKAMVLEFSKPVIPAFSAAYDWYSFNVLPKMGEIIAKDRESYQYLAESIRMHPDQETLKSMFAEKGFVGCRYQNLTMGVVAIHHGLKVSK